MAKIRFTNANIFSNSGDDNIIHGELIISDDRIEAIHPYTATAATSKNDSSIYDQTYDLKGKFILPGFIQTHVHLCQTLFRNRAEDLPLLPWLEEKIWPFEAAHTYDSLYVSACLGIAELLASGTTTILDMGTLHHNDAIFSAMERMGIRGFSGKCMMDESPKNCALKETQKDSLEESVRLAEKWHGYSKKRLNYALAPRFVLSCSRELFQEVRKLSHEKNILIHTHASENPEEVKAIEMHLGCSNIEYFEQLDLTSPNLVLAHCVWLSDTEKRIVQTSGTKVVHCPSTNLKLASGIAPIPEYLQLGITVGIGADGSPCNNNLNIFQEMKLASLLQKPLHGAKALNAKNVWQMSTQNGAKILGLESEIGSLVVGKKADFFVLDLEKVHSITVLKKLDSSTLLNALVYSASPQNIVSTWVDGEILYSEGKYPFFEKFSKLNPLELVKNTLKTLT